MGWSLNTVTRLGKYWPWVLLVGCILIMLSVRPDGGTQWNPIEQLIVETTSPFQKLITQTIKITKGVWLKYFYLVNLTEENKHLRIELDTLRIENARHQELLCALTRFEKLLNFTRGLDRPVVAAQVIGWDPAGWFKSVIIDKGRDAGLQLNRPVVNASGVVGRIVSVSSDYAKVLLIIDQNSAVDCIVQRSRDRGMVKGESTEICRVDYIDRVSNVTVGDIVVSSGLGGVFPKGLPVGKVVSLRNIQGRLFKQIEIKPSVDFSKLEEVLVILKE
jgi:rod shape-determining protein MreC